MRAHFLTSLGLMAALTLTAQQPAKPGPPSPPVSLKGCVSEIPRAKRYVLASGGKCYLLNQDYKADEVVGKTITLRGTVVQPFDMNPLTLQVTKGGAPGEACSQTCTLEPPDGDGRGFPHGKEKPGSEAGPPGLKPPPPTN